MDKRVVAAELKKIEDKYGRLTPAAVVMAARRKNHPLHGLFDWNDEVAGHKWRLVQARNLINSVTVQLEIDDRRITAVAYVRDPNADPHEQGYRSIVRIATDDDDARAVVVAEFARAAAHLRRARDLAVALGYADDIDRLIADVTALDRQIQATPSPRPNGGATGRRGDGLHPE